MSGPTVYIEVLHFTSELTCVVFPAQRRYVTLSKILHLLQLFYPELINTPLRLQMVQNDHSTVLYRKQVSWTGRIQIITEAKINLTQVTIFLYSFATNALKHMKLFLDDSPCIPTQQIKSKNKVENKLAGRSCG